MSKTDKTNTAPSEDAPIETGIDLTEIALDFFPSAEEILPSFLVSYWHILDQFPWVKGIIVFFFFWFIAYIVNRYVVSLIRKLAEKTETKLDDQIISSLHLVTYRTIIISGSLFALDTAEMLHGVGRYFISIAFTMVVFVWTQACMRLSHTIFTALSNDPKKFQSIDFRSEPLFVITSKIIILVIASYIVLVIWGINPIGLLASAGIVGLAVGFAAKDSLANLFSGIFILADRPYKMGDYINLETGERGKVTHIGIRSSRILTRDGIEVTIPNGIIGNAKVVNESGGFQKKIRIRIDTQVAYGVDLEFVNDLLIKIADEYEEICQFPSPVVRIRGFADSGISLQLLCWINDPQDRGRITHFMYLAIYNGFRDNDIEIPYPRRDIQILNNEPPKMN